MDKGQLAAAGAQRAGQGPSCKVVWLIRGSNTRIEAQCIPASHGRSTMAANALPGVLHAIAQRRPTAHFRAGDDTAELLDPTAAALAEKYPVGALLVKRYEF